MPDTWTITNSLIYLVPLLIAVLVVVIYGAAESLATYSGVRCNECGHRFKNEFALRRHLKDVERSRKEERKKAA